MEAAFRGQRRLVLLNKGERELSLTFTPLSHPLEADSPTVLVMLSRQSACDNLAVRMFARTIGLSPSEEAVLLGLCRGLEIPEIASEHGVASSTIRSEIKTLREKAGSPSIRRLLQRINSLPPVVPALRIVPPMPHNAADSIHP
jgi:DNA-binding CsgD family transcriptional regulator